MSTPRCPTCERPIAAPPGNPAHPFCSARCKLIDLGNWLDGAYRIPGPPTWLDEGDDGSGPPPS